MIFGLFVEQAESGAATPRMVGMARLIGDGDTNVLGDVYILPEHQGSGLGVAFLKYVLEADGRDKWRFLLHTGDRKDWYVNKLGFRVVGEASRAKMLGLPLFILEKDGLAIAHAQQQEHRS
jgi:GNAT superfamily N-acetyltransferase